MPPVSTPPHARAAASDRPGLLRRVGRALSQGPATWRREFIVLGVVYGLYELSRGLTDTSVRDALANGRDILHLEQMWHLSPERVLNGAIANVTWVAVAASYFYSLMHYVVTPIVLVWMYRKHREAYGRARTALALSTLLGLIGYALLPTAPPRLLAHSGLQDTLAHTSGYGWWEDEGSVPRGLGALTNQFAAMPSLHVGWAIWCGVLIAMYARRRWVKAIGAAYPVATTLVVKATGNHYLLDAFAGAITMAAGTGLMLMFTRRHRDPLSSGHESLDEVVAGRSFVAVRAVSEAARDTAVLDAISSDQVCSRGTSR
jgi:hypothetical protein